MPLGVRNLDVVKPETTLRQRLAGRRFDVMFVVVGRESLVFAFILERDPEFWGEVQPLRH